MKRQREEEDTNTYTIGQIPQPPPDKNTHNDEEPITTNDNSNVGNGGAAGDNLLIEALSNGVDKYLLERLIDMKPFNATDLIESVMEYVPYYSITPPQRRHLKVKMLQLSTLLHDSVGISSSEGGMAQLKQIIQEPLVEEEEAEQPPQPVVPTPDSTENIDIKVFNQQQNNNSSSSIKLTEVIPLQLGPCYALRPAMRLPVPSDAATYASTTTTTAAQSTGDTITASAGTAAPADDGRGGLTALSPSKTLGGGGASSSSSLDGRVGRHVVPNHTPPLSCLNTAYVSFDPIPRRKGSITQEGKVPLPPLKAAVHGIEDLVIGEDIRHRGVEEILRYVQVYSPNVLMVRPNSHPLSKRRPATQPAISKKQQAKEDNIALALVPSAMAVTSTIITRKQRRDKELAGQQQEQQASTSSSSAVDVSSMAVVPPSSPPPHTFVEGQTCLPTRLNAQLFHLCAKDEEDLHLLFDKGPGVLLAALEGEHRRNLSLRDNLFRSTADIMILTSLALHREASIKSLANCEEVAAPSTEACLPMAGGSTLQDLIRAPGSASMLPSHLRCPIARQALALFLRTCPFQSPLKLALVSAVNHCIAICTEQPVNSSSKAGANGVGSGPRASVRHLMPYSTLQMVEVVAGFTTNFCTAAQGLPGGRRALLNILNKVCDIQGHRDCSWWFYSEVLAAIITTDPNIRDVASMSALPALAPWCWAIATRGLHMCTHQAEDEEEEGEAWEVCVDPASEGIGLDGYCPPDALTIRYMD